MKGKNDNVEDAYESIKYRVKAFKVLCKVQSSVDKHNGSITSKIQTALTDLSYLKSTIHLQLKWISTIQIKTLPSTQLLKMFPTSFYCIFYHLVLCRYVIFVLF